MPARKTKKKIQSSSQSSQLSQSTQSTKSSQSTKSTKLSKSVKSVKTQEIKPDPIALFLTDENRWVFAEPEQIQEVSKRVFDQAAVLHTSEERPVRLTRAYNLESSEAINDGQLELGAEERGQTLGDVSGGEVNHDGPPERE